MKIINSELLDSVSGQAKESPRLRMNYNFHESPEAPIQRMLNALEPGTYLVPHRHPDKEEIYLILKGSLFAYFYDNNGNVIEKIELNPLKGVYGLEIPAGTWHNIEVLESGTVIYELKQGPYHPLSAEDIASWTSK